ncbi:MAG: 6-phosphogluconolactonase [Chromatiales bacterium]|nr:MAG: 6-phosphogluconolactonase [Chromatiales bacterium]
MSAETSCSPDWRVCADAAALATEAAACVAALAEAAIQRRGEFRIALAGGTTPQALYRELRSLAADWAAWHIYFGDERCVPADDPDRNDRMAREAWLDHVPIPAAHVHPIPAEAGATAAARIYADALQSAGRLDLALLGVGEDGHTASLFPGMDLGDAPDAPLVLPVYGAPKPPAERVTLSLAALNAARSIIVIADGPGKRNAIAKWQSGADLPISRLAPSETLLVFLTESAAPDGLPGSSR